MANLPPSPFQAMAVPYYGGYTALTRQYQNWGMYGRPDHFRINYELLAVFPDGKIERVWDRFANLEPRKAYFLETLANHPELADYTTLFLDHLYAGFPESRKPRGIHLQKLQYDVPELPGREREVSDPPAVSEVRKEW